MDRRGSKRLSGFGYGVHVLRTEVEAAIRRLPNNWNKRLAIVVAGFDSSGGPLCAEAANFDTATGSTSDQNAFKLDMLTLIAGRKTASHTAGNHPRVVPMRASGSGSLYRPSSCRA